MASFPTSIKSFTTKTDNVTDVLAEHVNSLQDEVVALETMYGINGVSWIGEGVLYNGKIVVTVAANNITVALKTMAGADASASTPIYVRINGAIRTCTAALAVTKNAGTNWFASGTTGLATAEIDYFVYLIWNTTPATDIVDIGFARVPYFNVYSEASGTTTNEKYLANANGSAPTATDDMVVIGRFAATLSATAAFNWSVPTFTTTNLIQRPIYESRILNYTTTLTWTAGAAPTGGTGFVYTYHINGKICFIKGQGYSMTAGTTVTQLVVKLPFIPLLAASSGGVQMIPAFIGIATAEPNATQSNIQFTSSDLTIICTSCSATIFFWQGYYFI
jgi:hypothetical protein